MELKWRHFIDASKGLTPVVVLGLMQKFDRWDSATAWTYFGLHGSYGVLWVLKSQIFPDLTWERPITLRGEALEEAKKGGMNPFDLIGRIFGRFTGMVIFSGLMVYWWNAYIICKRNVKAPAWLLGLTTFTYGIGVFLHFASDMQKHVRLQHKKGLITDLLFSRTRNPNYLGELMIYGSFAALPCDPFPPLYLLANLLLMWLPNMLKKDKSISRHEGWAEYKSRSGLLFPSVCA